jgi:hypothetical protein
MVKETLKRDFNLKTVQFKEQIGEDLYFEALGMDRGSEFFYKFKPETGTLFYKTGTQWIQVKGYIFKKFDTM